MRNFVIFLDANIIIYALKPEYQYILELLEAENDELGYSEMVRLEVMGFSSLASKDRQKLEEFFEEMTAFPIDQKVIESAIKIRQQKSIKSPDAIIAATALVANQKLWTSNVADFSWIKNLGWHNPVMPA